MEREVTYAVGDVHGRADLLEAVVTHAVDDASSLGARPVFVFLGDVVDRGARSRDAMEAVLSAVSDHGGSVMLRGNHDDMFLSAMNGEFEPRGYASWLARGGIATLESYLQGDLRGAPEVVRTLHGSHLEAISQAPLTASREGLLFAHAGIDPSKPLGRQADRDLMWIRDQFLDHVGPLERAVVHGHSVVGDRPVVTENRVSIDTGAYASGRLTVFAVGCGAARFFQTDGRARHVVEVEPVLLDRGFGTAVSGGRLHPTAAAAVPMAA